MSHCGTRAHTAARGYLPLHEGLVIYHTLQINIKHNNYRKRFQYTISKDDDMHPKSLRNTGNIEFNFSTRSHAARWRKRSEFPCEK